MTINTPDAETLGLEELFASAQAQIKVLRTELEAYTEEARAGEEVRPTAVKDTLTRMRGLVQQCSGLEKLLAETRQRQSGVVYGAIAFDFDSARDEIGCALDRIRACCCADGFSE
jgi:hypothetical protein